MRAGLFTIPPEIGASEQELFSVEEAVADIEGKLPGLLRYMDPSDPGMHTSDTIDFEVVLEGTVVLELDDGAEVTLHGGDTGVQNGTRYRWKNPGETPARLALFICGANHSAVPRRDGRTRLAVVLGKPRLGSTLRRPRQPGILNELGQLLLPDRG